MTPNPDAEQALEDATVALFADLGWHTANGYDETYGPNSTFGRESRAEVVLVRRLRAALQRLNPDLPPDAITQAIDELTHDRSVMSPAQANREICLLLKEGVKVTIPNRADGNEDVTEKVTVIDWNQPANNDFFLVAQFWVTGDMYKRRADLVGFVNGLPLLVVELKASHKRIEDAFNGNLRAYKDDIPQLFWYNAFVILSNGSQSRIGSITAVWEHFFEWKKINSEGEEGIISLDTMVRGTCPPARLLDIVENFVLYEESQGGLVKLVAKNHQYLGVGNAIAAVQQIRENQGRLGVFWHTQGSGKSYSMVFFAQKILRKLPGNWTFVVVTDRENLDNQIYQNFANTGAVTEKENRVRANSGKHLQTLLQEDHRYVFTTIQKFRTERGERYPRLSDRADVIVITDEAHRSQYDIHAANMRAALPNAAFIGFTATPLMEGEERTKEVFGDYVSIYNFKQSRDDGVTVPLYYENRIPELQLVNPDLNQDIANVLESVDLKEDAEDALERQFAHEYQVITREDRLEKIAEDIVAHFMGRGHHGKAMVVSVDKATAVKMYDKVQKHWQAYLAGLRRQLAIAMPNEREAIEARIAYMTETDMAVVVSPSQNEVADLQAKGVDITPHRKRMVAQDLDTKFKDEDDPFRIVFVCAMWMTGFDVPCCSTIYLDKPMRNHTLMQTIARANRVFPDKTNGLIVDYIGIFRDLKRALAIYGSGAGGGIQEGDSPVESKQELVERLHQAVGDATTFCEGLGIDLPKIQAATGFERIRLFDDAANAILINDETRDKYLALAKEVVRLFRAVLPDPVAQDIGPDYAVFAVLADKLRSYRPQVDVTEAMDAVEDVLDKSVTAIGKYIIPTSIEDTSHLIDLSKIDFDRLKAEFEAGHKRIAIEKLRGAINSQLKRMVRLNKSRMDFLQTFQEMIDEYNAGARDVDVIFNELVAFTQALNEEEQRGVSRGLTEEELAIFDLLTKPDLHLTSEEEAQVKQVAHDLLATLKSNKLVLDWRKKQQARASVQMTIAEILDQLPPAYTKEVYDTKCSSVYLHVFDSYYGQGRSVYAMAA